MYSIIKSYTFIFKYIMSAETFVEYYLENGYSSGVLYQFPPTNYSKIHKNCSTMIQAPKIFISNFEDLIEYWEEALATKSSDTSTHKTLFDGIQLNFISAEVPPKRIKEPNKFQKTIAAKCRILKTNFVYFVLGLG